MKPRLIPNVSMVLVLTAAAAGCGIEQGDERPVALSTTRMIVQPEETRFDIETVREGVPAPIPDLVTEGVDGWKAREGDPVTFARGGIVISRGGDFVSLHREVNWDADQIDALQLSISNLGPSARGLRFYWAGPDGGFSESRMSRAIASANERWVASLVGHPNWGGPVSRIRLDVPTSAEGETVVRSIRAIRFEYNQNRIATASESFWKVELDDDLRYAGLVSSQRPLVWDLGGIEDGVLQFSYGLVGGSEVDLQLDAAIRSDDGEWVTVFEGGPRGTSEDPPALWREARVDLDGYGPVSAVRFAVGPAQGSVNLAAVANPVVSHPVPGRPRPNVLLISLDTLRADRLATFGYEKTTSPTIDSWAAHSGVIFRNTVAPSPRTLPSHVSMLTGMDCLSHGVNHLSPAPLALEMLPEILRRSGYSTVGTVGGGLMNPSFGIGQGFDEFYHFPGWSGGFDELEVELDRALDKVSRVWNRPFFLFFHTYEIHDPFHERAPFSDVCFSDLPQDSARDYIYGELPRERSVEDQFLLYYDLVKWKKGEPVSTAVPVGADELELVNCLYDSAITYVDSQVDRLLGRLQDMGVLENTLVIVTSDHGESLGEKGLFKHANLYENNLMVPLVLRFPGGQQGGRVFDRQVSTVDIVPTVLEYLGIDAEGDFDGESLLPIIRGQGDDHRSEAWSYAAYENRGLSLRIDNQVKYIYNNSVPSPAHGHEELYKLEDDPQEIRNLATEDTEAADGLRGRLESYYKTKSTATRVAIDNRGCEVLEGTIWTKNLMTEMKALELSASTLELISGDQAMVRVPENNELELFIESTGIVDIRIEATGCGAAIPDSTVRSSAELSRESVRKHLRLTDRGWEELAEQRPSAADASVASVVIEVGAEGTRNIPDVLSDDAILEQLRTLGYVQ